MALSSQQSAISHQLSAFSILLVSVFIVFLFSCTDTSTPTSPAVDNIDPAVEWVHPQTGGELSGVVELRFRVSDEGGVDSARVYLDGYSPDGWQISDVTSELQVIYWNTLDSDDGVHILEARAWDASGNIGVSAGVLVRVQNHETPPEDHTPPVIRWISPTPGDTIEGTVELYFEVMDDVGVDSVRLIVNGRSPAAFILLAQQEVSFSFEWNSNNFEDGAYLVEISAWDASGNIGFGSPVSFRIWNNRPRVLWVPDNFETIQGAINASMNGDTVRVREGVYEEGVCFLGKNIWLESESGPEVTWIKGIGWNDGVRIQFGEDFRRTTLRGFRVTGSFNGIGIEVTGGITILNCLVDQSLFEIDQVNGVINYGRAIVANCIITSADWGYVEGYTEGDLVNTILMHCNTGYFGDATYRTLQRRHHNLFWDNIADYEFREPDSTDIFSDPQFEQGDFGLRPDSPAIDAGDAQIFDRDGSRSDIGLYGGPYAYPTP